MKLVITTGVYGTNTCTGWKKYKDQEQHTVGQD